jgi:hypothetical protein
MIVLAENLGIIYLLYMNTIAAASINNNTMTLCLWKCFSCVNPVKEIPATSGMQI